MLLCWIKAKSQYSLIEFVIAYLQAESDKTFLASESSSSQGQTLNKFNVHKWFSSSNPKVTRCMEL